MSWSSKTTKMMRLSIDFSIRRSCCQNENKMASPALLQQRRATIVDTASNLFVVLRIYLIVCNSFCLAVLPCR